MSAERPTLRCMTTGTAESRAREMFPPVVYVPCAPVDVASGELTVDLRQTRDGRLALLVYSALDRLVACCGEDQPWTVLPSQNLEQIRLETGFELVFLDLEIPEEFRRAAGER
jgi:hypothetical protein